MSRCEPSLRLRPAPAALRWSLAAVALVLSAGSSSAQVPLAPERPDRPLSYRPDEGDFEIVNGPARFNRPLFGPHDSFRVDAGDLPEFAFFLPEKAGLLKVGWASPLGNRWFADAQRVSARYRPGSMVYEMRDTLLGSGVLRLTAIPLKDADGLVLRVELSEGTPVDFVWAFGGASGVPGEDRTVPEAAGSRRAPYGPADFAGGVAKINGTTFEYQGRGATMNGSAPGDSHLFAADFSAASSINALLGSKASDQPLVAGRVTVRPGLPVHLVIQKAGKEGVRTPGSLANIFKDAEKERMAIVAKVAVDSPDAFVDAAAGELAIAADALWQGPGMKTGDAAWRGIYLLDEFGWFDRAAQHFTSLAARQNADANDLPAAAQADPARNLSADDGRMLHSLGSLRVPDRDGNLLFADALLRHFRWTGDVAYLRQMWPVLQRHFAYEKRVFDRDGLYEGYSAIPAARALATSGGGAMAPSADNYLHNKIAVQLATLIGQDPAPHRQEMAWIVDAIRHNLWAADRGAYAEFKDILGSKRVHTSAALWSVVHAIDSEVADPFEAYQALRYVDTEIARLPIRGNGVPEGELQVIPTSNWISSGAMLNNVIPAESAHAALAFWQAGRSDEAWKLWRGTIVDSMFRGGSPGALPAFSAEDVLRGLSGPGGGDAAGALGRGLVEGLFGIVPDALAGELLIRPGFPADWDHASLRTSYINYSYRQEGQADKFVFEPKFPKPMKLKLVVPARGDRVLSVQVNGKAAAWTSSPDAVGQPRIEVRADPAAKIEVTVRWTGESLSETRSESVQAIGRTWKSEVAPARALEIRDPQGVLRTAARSDDGFSGTATGTPGHRTLFIQVKQSDLTWWMPVELDLRPAFEIVQSATQDAQRTRFRVKNNTMTAWEKPAVVDIGGQKSTVALRAPANGESNELLLPVGGQYPGANPVRIELGEQDVAEGTVVNWQIAPPATAGGWRIVELGAVFNDRATQLFRNEYLSPRSSHASLQMPKQGLGSWLEPAATFAVDDSGLRRAAGAAKTFTLPGGIPLRTPSGADEKNIAFTSLWSNYPPAVTVPLTGRASHAYLLLTGTTNAMQEHIDNGEIVIAYRDGSSGRLALENPTNWWPIDRDYFIDDAAFRFSGQRPLRVELGTGRVYTPSSDRRPAGGAATVIDLPLDPDKTLESLTVRTLSNEVVIGLLSLTLAR